jgi:hypothetical protein
MADKKITALTATTTVVAADVIPVVTDTTGTPTTKKVTAANLAAYTSTGLATSAAPTFSGVVTLAVGASLQGASSTRVEVHGLRLPATHTIEFEGATDDAFETVLTVVDPTADRTITFPNATGTVALTSDLATYATLASPTLTGTPAAPTATAGTSTTQIATTAFADPQGDQYVLAGAVFNS